jgi:Arc/MetJ-type ribon-helix-helix transcriptional regulator
MAQVVVRLPDDLTASLDELVSTGAVASRSDAVREGLGLLLDAHRRTTTGEQIVAGYLKTPQSVDDGAWADEQTRAMIADEPW